MDYYENMGAGEGVYGRDTMRLIALSVFSFLVLNFLIGVITEAYEVEKGCDAAVKIVDAYSLKLKQRRRGPLPSNAKTE